MFEEERHAGFCVSFLLGHFSIFNDSDEDIIIIYTDYSEQVFLGLRLKKKRKKKSSFVFFGDKSQRICLKAKTEKNESIISFGLNSVRN